MSGGRPITALSHTLAELRVPRRLWRHVIDHDYPPGALLGSDAANAATDWHIYVIGTPAGLTETRSPMRALRQRPDGRAESIDVWLIRLWRDSSGLRVERRWHPEFGWKDVTVRPHRPRGIAQDMDEALAAFAALDQIEAAVRPARRPRIEEETDQIKLECARQAIETKRQNPSMPMKDIAIRLGLVEYDDEVDDPLLDKKAERSATVKLGRWIKALKKSDNTQ